MTLAAAADWGVVVFALLFLLATVYAAVETVVLGVATRYGDRGENF